MNYTGIIEINKTGKVLFLNPQFAEIFGYEPYELVNESIGILIQEQVRGVFLKRLNLFLDNCIRYGSEGNYNAPIAFPGSHRDGSSRVITISLAHYENHDQFVFIGRENQTEGEITLSDYMEQFPGSAWNIASGAGEIVVQINQDLIITYANSLAGEIFGYPEKSLIGEKFNTLFPLSVFKRYHDLFRKYLYVDHEDWQKCNLNDRMELLGQTVTGRVIPLEISFGNSWGNDDEVLLTCVMRELKTQISLEKELQRLMFRDRITGLGNADSLYTYLKRIVSRIPPGVTRRGLLMRIELRDLKRLRQGIGDGACDGLFLASANRLQIFSRNQPHSAEAFQLSKKELCLILPTCETVGEGVAIAGEVIKILSAPFELSGDHPVSSVTLKAAIGMDFLTPGRDPLTTLTHAENAKDFAIDSGPNSYAFPAQKKQNEIINRLLLEERLTNAVRNQLFELHYQPIVDGEDRVIGMEALLRWRDSDFGLISPSIFIPLMEEREDLLLQTGSWVLETACRHTAYWNRKYKTDLSVFVNISVRQFESDIVETVGQALKHSGLDPRFLELELTESGLMKAPETAISTMHEIKERYRGLRIAIDDFGTGMSSLSYFSNFPANTLKIDRCFVSRIRECKVLNVIKAITSLAKSADMDLIAEGVNNHRQREILTEMGCNHFQGFSIGEPISASEFEENLFPINVPYSAMAASISELFE